MAANDTARPKKKRKTAKSARLRQPKMLSLHEPEIRALEWLCRKAGVSRSDWVRRYINLEALAHADEGCPLPVMAEFVFDWSTNAKADGKK